MTKQDFFKPTKLSAEAKNNLTNSVVRDILAAETSAREKKTENLRALRLALPVVETVRKVPQKTSRKA